ncbi:MAG TPA: SDR family NAD(P)-dependent oxidoreductase [Bdellovibrionales bacterium]|nr:SDR family NAD(P)-dependent oxidoreductase [Bdellovibrionales bacterium]
MTQLKGKRVLITGATAGIGEACAIQFARQGCNLVITGRRTERLKELSKKLSSEFGVRVDTLAFDVSNRAETEKALSSIDLSDIAVLVNNAGLARGTESMQKANIDDWEVMVDTNIKGLLYVTRTLIPKMLQKNEGHIVNIGSVAGRWVYPGGGVYCATKFAVRALSEGLRFDLLGTPIRITNIEPGMVETDFSKTRFDGDTEKAAAVYKGMNPLKANDIAETALWCVMRPAHVNIQELVIFPTDQAAVGPYVHRRA